MTFSRATSLRADGVRLETLWLGPGPDEAPTLVLLHEGLGSVTTWRDWPYQLAEHTGLGVLVYSRAGYGKSDPVPVPRPLDYMQREGRDVLPQVLDAAGVRRAVLVGHSDGASIAMVHAATERVTAGERRVRGLVLLAPHVICEDVSVRSIAATREQFLQGDLKARLQRHHGDNTDVAFWGWNRAWLDPRFAADFDLRGYLPDIRVPTTVVQGDADVYGTLAQVDLIEQGARGVVSRVVLPGAGHALHRERPEETKAVVARLADRVLER